MPKAHQITGCAKVYKKFVPWGDPRICFYCGDASKTEHWDHQPPRKYRDRQDAEFWKVPCCRRCNARLGARFTATLQDRFQLAIDRGLPVVHAAYNLFLDHIKLGTTLE